MHAMVNHLDTSVSHVIQALKDSGLWDRSLVVFHGDNGGEILEPSCGGNNYPLRGGKFSNWEGGIRVNAFITGGVLPSARRGQKETSLISVADWYRTYCELGE